jgi:hypothetical protein
MAELVLHARGKDPIKHFIVSDTMLVSIIHNAYTDAVPADTACVNSSCRIGDVIYRDVNMISWSSSGDGYFMEQVKNIRSTIFRLMTVTKIQYIFMSM